jgi:DnaK suppressor protein
VRAALKRIDDGTYGKCVVDGEPIDEKRLESVPWTPYCLKHQAELEERARIRPATL